MSQSAEGRKAVRAFGGGLVYFFPSLISLPLFLVLYNNFYYGNLILVVLILLNVSALMIPQLPGVAPRTASVAKFASLSIVSVVSAVLIIEMLFPFFWPKDYANVLDLSKSFLNDPIESGSEDVVLFKNADQRLAPTAPSRRKPTETFKVWHAPGKQFVYHGWDPNSKTRYENVFYWNSQGYFDHDYDPHKPLGTHRIAVIGDSYVEAVQVPLMGSFHKRLETYLNKAAGPGLSAKFEVMAFGSSGTGQVDHYRALPKIIDVYHPDTVLMTLCSNDLCDDDPKLKAEFLLASHAFVGPTLRRLVTHGYFALAFAFKRTQEIRANRVSISPELLQWANQDIPRIEAAWARTLGKIRESRDYCRDRGVSFILVYLGSELEVKYAIDPEDTIARLKDMGGPHEDITWDLGKSVRRVDSFCKKNDILEISLLDSLISAQRETGQLVFGDHYTMFGHQVAARSLESALEVRLQPQFAQTPQLKYSTSKPSWNPVATPATFEGSRGVPVQNNSRAAPH
jgi:lysophospholipase L1-like esterase